MSRRISGSASGPDLEVVVDRRGLAVEREAQPVVGLHPLEELVDQVDQTHPEDLERLVPLAIPVGVGDQVDDARAVSPRRVGGSGAARRRRSSGGLPADGDARGSGRGGDGPLRR